MKKIVAIVLCMIIIASSSIIVYAAQTVTGTSTDGNFTYNPSGGNSQIITASYETTDTTPSYSVDITWGSLKYVYEATGTWNINDTKYVWSVTKDWTCASGANEIKMVNHSNQEVTATFEFSPVNTYLTNYGFTNLEGKFTSTKNGTQTASSNMSTTLDSAEGAEYKATYDEYQSSGSTYFNKVTDMMTLKLTSSEPTKIGTSVGDETVGTVTITLTGS